MIALPICRGFNKPRSAAASLALVGYTNSAFAASSKTLSLPVGSQAGHLCILQDANGWDPNTVAGFTTLNRTIQGNWQGYCAWKILTSGDISTGTVTATFSNSFDVVMSLAVFSGFSTGVKTSGVSTSSGGGTTNVGPSISTITANDYVLYFGSGRFNGTITPNRGTVLQQFNNGGSATGCLFGEVGVTGTINPSWSYSGTPSGYYQTIIVIE